MSNFVSFGLGLDQGVASIGWSIVRLNESGIPIGIERLGVHLFEPGTDGDIESGRDESRAGPRRMARQARKQYRRRTLRKRRLMRWLQELGLLPAGDVNSPEGRDKLMKELDAALRKKWEIDANADHRTRQLLPYRLRAAGLTGRLEPYELGRALYHLAQRRGYLSNRKQMAAEAGEGNESGPTTAEGDGATKKQKAAKEGEGGEVRAAIVELQRQMVGAGCSTLAEYFSKLDPAGTLKDRLRGRWTAREMFLEEFNRICDTQAAFHSALNAKLPERLRHEIRHPSPTELNKRRKHNLPKPSPAGSVVSLTGREQLHDAIFHQRPLQSMSHLVGRCELVPGEKRAPLGHRASQRFRVLQQVNNLIIELPDYTKRPLTPDERTRLLDALQHEGDIAFTKLRTKAWFHLPKGTTFNLERGGEKRLVGNRTEAKCRRIFGSSRWDAMSEAEKDAVVHDLLVFEKPQALAKRGQEHYGLSREQAIDLSECTLEPGHASHSLAAFAKLIPRMEEGTHYMSAVKDEFGVDDSAKVVHDLLPSVEKALGDQRNPAVMRALTELRKLVNAVVRRYGKPAWIRLELARELKRARKHRERMSRENRAQQDRRDNVRAEILKKTGIPAERQSRADIERVLLAEECGWVCPYTGKSFGMQDVIGKHPQVDVEHIWPLPRSLDDSFLNKTLCFVEENRNIKKNKTPYEAYSRLGERWSQILDRVRRFKGDAARIKFERFEMTAIPEGFAERHLAETRKIAAASAEYLGCLYGGDVDPQGARRVFVTTGGLTAHLRREWHLNGLLSDNPEKTRDDHRHHAIDALVVALTDTRAVQVLQRAAEQASAAGRRMFAAIDPPWDDFVNTVRARVDEINVSHRQSRRVSGKLHAETNYSRPTGPNGDRRVRKEVGKLTEKDVERIVDPKVKAAVIARLNELKGPPNKVFAIRENHPFTLTKAGQKNWIHKVRISTGEKPWSVGKGPRERFVTSTSGSNHHALITKDEKGKWKDLPVTLLEVQRSSKMPKRPHGAGDFTIAAGEFLLLKDGAGSDRLLRVTKLSEGQIAMIRHFDARRMDDIKKSKDVVYRTGSSLVRDGARKVSVTYLGEIRRSGG